MQAHQEPVRSPWEASKCGKLPHAKENSLYILSDAALPTCTAKPGKEALCRGDVPCEDLRQYLRMLSCRATDCSACARSDAVSVMACLGLLQSVCTQDAPASELSSLNPVAILCIGHTGSSAPAASIRVGVGIIEAPKAQMPGLVHLRYDSTPVLQHVSSA